MIKFWGVQAEEETGAIYTSAALRGGIEWQKLALVPIAALTGLKQLYVQDNDHVNMNVNRENVPS